MAYATAAQMLARKDVRTIGDLCSDDSNRVPQSELLSSSSTGGARLAAALDDASGEIESALLQGNRYTVDDLEDLTGNSQAYLVRITCEIAMAMLFQRRPQYKVDEYEAAQRLSDLHLERLRKGEHVFNVAAVKDAGTPDNVTPSLASIANLYLIRDQTRNYYPARRQ